MIQMFILTPFRDIAKHVYQRSYSVLITLATTNGVEPFAGSVHRRRAHNRTSLHGLGIHNLPSLPDAPGFFRQLLEKRM